jgi:hypothetical protein
MTGKNKNFEKGSVYEEYDIDSDGTVTDEELESARDIRRIEQELQKQRAQRFMAAASLIGIGVFTALMFTPIVSLERIKALSGISDLFYISMAGVVGAYMGMTAWMHKK